jgi:hypothetical protein
MKIILKKIYPLYKLYLFLYKLKIVFFNYLIIPSYKTKRKTILKTANDYNLNQYFIETGTYFGDTVDYFKNYFVNLITIELSPDLAKRASDRFKSYSNVSVINGDSSKELINILKFIDSPIVFWLDGHYSSEFWIGENLIITAKGEKYTPILEELTLISNHFVKNHVILIDDARLFTGNDDYPKLSVIKEFVSTEMKSYFLTVKNDIIRILPKKIIKS